MNMSLVYLNIQFNEDREYLRAGCDQGRGDTVRVRESPTRETHVRHT